MNPCGGPLFANRGGAPLLARQSSYYETGMVEKPDGEL